MAMILQTPNSPTTLKGSGLEVTADLRGWTLVQGPGILHDDYVRLGLFEGKNDQELSILVDNPPRDIRDLSGLCKSSLQSYKGSKLLEERTVAQKPACMFDFVAISRRNIYVEMLIEDRWLEFHYSGPDSRSAAYTGRKALEAIIGSLSATRSEIKPGELLYADITDAEITAAERSLNCNAKSRNISCQALAAFKVGKRPTGRPKPIGVAGAAFLIFFNLPVTLDPLDKPIVGYLVVSDTRVSALTLGANLSKEQEKAEKEVLDAVNAGKHPDDTNLVVIAARSSSAAAPADLAERSLIFKPAQIRVFVRETSVGLVGFSLLDSVPGMFLAIYPTP
jgi:hypothetical protein